MNKTMRSRKTMTMRERRQSSTSSMVMVPVMVMKLSLIHIFARAQGNYASIDAIAEDVRAKLGGETIGVIFPILSRNRFSICLKGIARGAKKVVLMLSYPSDEVGNSLVSLDQVDEAGINPYSDVLDLKRYREPVSYTHLDVYKRQAVRIDAGLVYLV